MNVIAISNIFIGLGLVVVVLFFVMTIIAMCGSTDDSPFTRNNTIDDDMLDPLFDDCIKTDIH